MPIKFEYLIDRPQDVPLVIHWWHSVWADRMGSDLDKATEQLRSSLGKSDLPVHILATLEGEPVGTATLKLQEQEKRFPDKHFWLGGVFVAQEHRGGNIASELSMEVVAMAQSRGIPHLYLQTVNLSGGLYTKLGWQRLMQFDDAGQQTLLMRKRF